MKGKDTFILHDPFCPYEYAWDIAPELYVACSCNTEKHWPRQVCSVCLSHTVHKKNCRNKEKK